MNIQIYLLNSIFTHKSCQYVTEGALNGFAIDAALVRWGEGKYSDQGGTRYNRSHTAH